MARPLCAFFMALFLSSLSWGQGASKIKMSEQKLPTITVRTKPVLKKQKAKKLPPSDFKKVDMSPALAPITSQYDEIKKLPGVQTREQSQSAPAISIRGSVKSDRVLSIYNGLSLNTADGLGPRRLLVPKEILKPIRIFKGPVSAKYGGSAMGGAALFENRFFERGQLTLSGGGAPFTDGGGSAVIPLISNKKNPLQMSAYGYKTTGEYDFKNVHTGKDTFRKNNDRTLQRYTLNGKQRSGSWRFRESFVIANEFGTTPGAVTNPEPTTFNSIGGLGSIEVGKKINRSWLISAQSSFLTTDSSFSSLSGEFADTNLKNTKIDHSLKSKMKLMPHWKSTTVFDYSQKSVKGLSGVSNQNQSDFEIASLNKFKINKSWQVDADARILTNYQTAIPSLQATHFFSNQKAWAKYSEGYRPPSISDKFANFPGFQGNPDLSPERSRQLEAGYHIHSKYNYDLVVSAFALFYSDFIGTKRLNENLSTIDNQGDARTLGVETSYTQHLGRWTLGISGTYLNTNNSETGGSILLTPDIEATGSVAYKFMSWKFSLLHTYWSEATDEIAGEKQTLDSGMRTDIRAEAKFDDWFLAGAVENILNNPREMQFGFPDPQRQFKFSLGYTF